MATSLFHPLTCSNNKSEPPAVAGGLLITNCLASMKTGNAMMKIGLSTIFVLTIVSAFFAQTKYDVSAKTKTPKLIVKGTIEKIEVEIDKPSSLAQDKVYIYLKLSLENMGSIPVIFLQPEPIGERAVIVYKDDEGYKEENIVADTFVRGSSYGMKEKEWEKINDDLDKPKPPTEKTFFIFPGSVIAFEEKVRIDLPQHPENHTFSLRVNHSLNSLKENSPLGLILKLDTWTKLPLVIGNTVESKKQEMFGQKLRKQWKRFGYLWLERITSVPIEIDFNTVTYKPFQK